MCTYSLFQFTSSIYTDRYVSYRKYYACPPSDRTVQHELRRWSPINVYRNNKERKTNYSSSTLVHVFISYVFCDIADCYLNQIFQNSVKKCGNYGKKKLSEVLFPRFPSFFGKVMSDQCRRSCYTLSDGKRNNNPNKFCCYCSGLQYRTIRSFITSRGADTAAKDDQLVSPLHYAAFQGGSLLLHTYISPW